MWPHMPPGTTRRARSRKAASRSLCSMAVSPVGVVGRGCIDRGADAIHATWMPMRITEVEPILLRGEQQYRAAAGGDGATDNGDWQLLVRVGTDAGLTGWADVETLAPAAVAIIAGRGMSVMGFRTLSEL